MRRPSLLVLILLATVLGNCSGPEKFGAGGQRWNVLLVTFDTTRADHIGCYGNDRIQTPTLDRLAAEGVRFARALSAVPITAPSHSTILTGRYPIAHGVRDNGLFVLGEGQQTLAEILRDHGYATAAAVGSFPLTSRFGLHQGFDLFDDHLTGLFEDYSGKRAAPKKRMFFDERRAAQVNEAVLPWLTEHTTQHPDTPFFAWVHYFDPHQPFEPAPPYDQLYADDLYNGEIAYADSRLGFLLERLKTLGVLDRTLVIMTADHGEGLGDHNELTHAVLAYNSTLHIPLILRPPAGVAPAGTVVDTWVGNIDILPTVLDLLGIEPPEGLQGYSLVPLWQAGARPSRRSAIRYAENLSPRLTHGWGELRVLFEGSLKYIHGPVPELYDLDADPHELRDLIAQRPDDARRLRDRLQAFLQRHAVADVSTTEPVDDEVRKRLQALGYLQSSGSGGETIAEVLRSDGAAPQEKVGDVNSLSAAKHLLFKNRPGDALTYTRKLVDTSPDNPLYLELHANALMGLGRLDEAWEVAEHLNTQGSMEPHLMFRLASLRFDHGEQRSTIDSLRAYLTRSPSASGARLLASFYKRLGDIEESLAALRQALDLDPGFAPARVDLATRLAEAEDPAAEREFLQALEDAPYYPQGYYNYGTFLLYGGRYPEAIGFLQRAIALTPQYLEARLALVAAHIANDDRPQAEEAYGELRHMAPRSRATEAAAELLAEP